MSILNYASMESDDIVAELLTLQGEHGRLKSKYEILSTEGAQKDAAIELAWEALRWGDSANEGDPDDKWTEIPRKEAMAAFNAIHAVRASGRRESSDD